MKELVHLKNQKTNWNIMEWLDDNYVGHMLLKLKNKDDCSKGVDSIC